MNPKPSARQNGRGEAGQGSQARKPTHTEGILRKSERTRGGEEERQEKRRRNMEGQKNTVEGRRKVDFPTSLCAPECLPCLPRVHLHLCNQLPYLLDEVFVS